MDITRIIDRPSPNYFLSIHPISAVVLHATAGSLDSALGWLTSPASQVSANYVIAQDGRIFRLVAYFKGRRSWANGIINNEDKSLEWLKLARLNNTNPNLMTISIEHEASEQAMRAGIAMPPVQLASSLWLTGYLLKQLGLNANSQSVIGHYQIDSVNKANCPGVINIPAYINRLNSL